MPRQHWALTIDATFVPAVGRVTLDDKVVLERQLANAVSRGTIEVFLGSIFVQGGDSFTIRYDDVKIEVPP